MFEFPQLTPIHVYVFIRSFIRPSWVCFMPTTTFTLVRVYVDSYHHVHTTITGHIPWLGLGQASSCLASSFAYLTTKENSSVRITRIAWFELNCELKSGHFASATARRSSPSPLAECTLFHFALTNQHARDLFFIYFSRAIFWRETIKYTRFVFRLISIMQDSLVMNVCRELFTRNNIQEFYTLKEFYFAFQRPDKISLLVINNAHSSILKKDFLIHVNICFIVDTCKITVIRMSC